MWYSSNSRFELHAEMCNCNNLVIRYVTTIQYIMIYHETMSKSIYCSFSNYRPTDVGFLKTDADSDF